MPISYIAQTINIVPSIACLWGQNLGWNNIGVPHCKFWGMHHPVPPVFTLMSPSFLPLHSVLETEALALSVHEFGTVCRAAYRRLTLARNILRHCWKHICFDKATALCGILYKRCRNILTYLPLNSFPLPSTHLLRSRSPKIRIVQWVWGSAKSSSSWVWGGAPAEIRIWCVLA